MSDLSCYDKSLTGPLSSDSQPRGAAFAADGRGPGAARSRHGFAMPNAAPLGWESEDKAAELGQTPLFLYIYFVDLYDKISTLL